MSPPAAARGARGQVEVSTGDMEAAELAEVIRSIEQQSIYFSRQKTKSLRARYTYGIVFLVINLCAWFIRDYGHSVLAKLPHTKACGDSGSDCFHKLGVLRVSLGCFIFFFIMFLSTFNTRKLHEFQNTWHTGCWILKFLLLVASMVAPFLLHPAYLEVYGEIARVGAGIFLALQLVSIIEFIAWWNRYWMPDEQSKQSCALGLFMSMIFFIASVCGIAVMYHLYAFSISCSLNIIFITWTVILLVAMTAISLHSKVNRGLLSSGLMASYVVFLCWSAIRSEPSDAKCSAHDQDGHTDWTNILSFLIAIFAIVMATFSTGIDSKSFQFRKHKVKLEDDIRYSYGFFHLVFSLGAMYFAMLFISWNLESSAREWSIDVGWTSTWVKIVNEWLAASVHIWKLISPVVRQPKIDAEPVQALQR